MAAYIYGNIEVTDPQLYEEYRRDVPALIAAHGGRYLVRGGAVTVLEGGGSPQQEVENHHDYGKDHDRHGDHADGPDPDPFEALRQFEKTKWPASCAQKAETPGDYHGRQRHDEMMQAHDGHEEADDRPDPGASGNRYH